MPVTGSQPASIRRLRLADPFYAFLSGYGITRASVSFEPDVDTFVHKDLNNTWTFRSFIAHDAAARPSCTIVLEFTPLVWGGGLVPADQVPQVMGKVTADFARAVWDCLLPAGVNFFMSGFDVMLPDRRPQPDRVGVIRDAINQALVKHETRLAASAVVTCAPGALTVLSYDGQLCSGDPAPPAEPHVAVLQAVPACDVQVVVDLFARPMDAVPFARRSVTLKLRQQRARAPGTALSYTLEFSPPIVVVSPSAGTTGLYADIRLRDMPQCSLSAFSRATHRLWLRYNLRPAARCHRSPLYTADGLLLHQSVPSGTATWALHHINVRPAAGLLRAARQAGAGSLLYRRSEALRGFVRLLAVVAASRASQIKRAFKRAITDPSYDLCRKRLMQEYVELVAQ